MSSKVPAPPAAPAKGATLNTTVGSSSTTKKTKPNRLSLQPTPEHQAELRQAFDLFDSAGTGRIAAPEVKIALRALGFEVSKEELRLLLAEVGTTPQGTLDFRDFQTVLMLQVGEKEPKSEVQRAFKHFDADDKGFISFEDLKGVCAVLNQDLSEDELKEMMMFASAAQGPRDRYFGVKDIPNITEEDFMRLMKRANVY